MNEEAGYVIEMKVGDGGMKYSMAGTAVAIRDAARASIAAGIGKPSVER